MSSFVGDGVINGWNLSDNVFPSLKISKGSGLIDGFFVSTDNDFSYTLDANGTFYAFAKRIIGSVGGTGNPSDLLTVTRVDSTGLSVISPPDNFLALSNPANPNLSSAEMTVILSWDDNTEVDFDHYNIYRSTGTDFDLLTTATVSEYVDSDVEENTTYFYRVTAEDESGNESGPSSATVTTPVSSVLPPNPRNFSLVASDGGINLLWFSPESVSFNSLSSYKISCSKLDTDDSVIDTSVHYLDKTFLNSRIDNLTNDTKYKINIQTIDTNNRISAGVFLTAIPKRDLGPPDPTLITVEESGYTDGPNGVRLNLKWVPGGTEYETAVNVNYRVYFTIDGQKNNNESLGIETAVDQLELDVAVAPFSSGNISIPENTLVTIRITAISKDRHESQGSFIRFRTGIYTITQPLRNATATYDIKTIKLSWWNNNDTEQVEIKVERSAIGSGTVTTISNETFGRLWMYLISRPALGYIYYFTLTPINKNGIRGQSSTVSQTTLTTTELALPPRPVDVFLSAAYKTMQISWRDTDSDLVESYRLYRSKTRFSVSYNDYTLIDNISRGTTTFIDYGLEEGANYTYYLTSIDIFGRESQHLNTYFSNVGLISKQIPVYEGELSSVSNAAAIQSVYDVDLTWDAFPGEPFDAFQILRSTGNLHSFEPIATVDYVIGQINYTYTDVSVLTKDGVNHYYIIQKIANNTSFYISTTNLAPDNSIYLGYVVTGASSFTTIDNSGRRDIANMKDSLIDLMEPSLLGHVHRGDFSTAETIGGVKYIRPTVNADLIDLNPSLVVTSWTTTDGINFYTEEDITGGTAYILKLNSIFPSIMYDIDEGEGRITFADAILQYDTNTNTFVGEANLELTVIGIEEVTNVLPNFRFDEINAQQVGYGKFVQAQLPPLGHEGRMKEELAPDRYTLSRYDNYTFFLDKEKDNVNPETLFGAGLTFFSVTDDVSEVEPVEQFDEDVPGTVVLFQPPTYSSYTASNISTGTGAVSADYSFSGTNSYKVNFTFTDDDEGRWVHLSTATFNPIISITKKISVKLLVQTGSFYFGMGVRKSFVANPVIGTNGGTSFSNGDEATTDFVGVSSLRRASPDYPDVPTPQGTYLVTANPGVWQTFEFDIPNETALPFTGNGSLTTENGYATLEHLNFTINTGSDDPTEEVLVYVDDILQITDAMAAGTNQGIQKSSDYGVSWELARYTETPIFKFYKSEINGYLWGISSKNVYLSTDIDHWYEIPGTKGVQQVRDMTEDASGNMYISTDRGVYVLELNRFSTFSEFVQTQPINPFSTECYSIFELNGDINVSTEMGIYETNDIGQVWNLTPMSPGNVVLYNVIETSSGFLAASKRKIFRKLSTESQFLEIADLNEQVSTIDEIWKIAYFNGNIYASTNDGVYQNKTQNMFEAGIPSTDFDRVFSYMDDNNSPGTAYSLDVIGDTLMIGSENSLYVSDVYNSISTKVKIPNKEIPSIIVDDEVKTVGFTYSSFNGVVSFRESVSPASVIKVDKLPRQVFFSKNEGWAQSNIKSPIIIRQNGEPKWSDFSLDETSVTTFADNVKTFAQNIGTSITSQNSYVPVNLINRTIASADIVLSGNVQYDASGNVLTTAPLINAKTVAELIKNYSLLSSSINKNLVSVTFPTITFTINGSTKATRTDTEVITYEDIEIDSLGYNQTLSNIISYDNFKSAFGGSYLESELLGALKYSGLAKTSPEGVAVYAVLNVLNQSKTVTYVSMTAALEARENFSAIDADGIIIDPASGKVSFTFYNDSVDPEKRNKYKFTKRDVLSIDLYGSVISDIGTISHYDIENELELVNSGLPIGLSNPAHGNLVKNGIFFERRFPYAFGAYYAQNIQSRYYPANRVDWYDRINSTIDYNDIAYTLNDSSGRIPFDTHWFNDDAYFSNKLWVCNDHNIIEYTVYADGSFEFSRIINPSGDEAEIRSIAVRGTDEIYVISGSQIFTSINFGVNWTEVDTTNLPDELYKLVILNDNLIVGTSDGMWWSGSGYDEFTRCTLSFSNLLTESERAIAEKDFVATILNVEQNNFSFMESRLNFYLSNSGIDFVALGALGLNEVSVVNKLYYYKNILWVATDKGLYIDAGTILSAKVSFSLQSINGSAYDSLVKINDITGSILEQNTADEALYIATSDGMIFQYIQNTWKSFQTHLTCIHKIHLIEEFQNKYIIAVGHDQITSIPVVIFEDQTETETVDILPCET